MPMAVTEAEDITEDGYCCSASGVCQALLEPIVWVLESFHEKVPHHRVKSIHDLPKDLDPGLYRFGLCIRYTLSTCVSFQVAREVALMCGYQIVVQRDCVQYELNDARRSSQRQDFVCPDTEITLSSLSMCLEEVADLLKDLLHDGVLSKIIVSTFKLRYIS